jgi:hypothetical protein
MGDRAQSVDQIWNVMGTPILVSLIGEVYKYCLVFFSCLPFGMINLCWPRDIVFRIIIEYISFKGFCLLETNLGEMIESKSCCTKIHTHLLSFYFVLHLLKCAPSPK